MMTAMMKMEKHFKERWSDPGMLISPAEVLEYIENIGHNDETYPELKCEKLTIITQDFTGFEDEHVYINTGISEAIKACSNLAIKEIHLINPIYE